MPTRREILNRAFAAAGATLAPRIVPIAPASARRLAPVPGGTFDSGVASGPGFLRRQTLWTRIHGLERDGLVNWELARDPAFAKVVAHGRTTARRAADDTAQVAVERRVIAPGEPHFYRFHTQSANSPVGRFVACRPPDSREPVRIAVWSCQAYEEGFYNAHRGMAAEDVDLVLCLGDYIYERAVKPGVRPDHTGANHDGDVQTLDDYRAKYRLYRADADLQAMHAAHSQLAFWDSHDVEPSPTTGDRDQYGAARRVTHEVRLRNGMQAFLENMPQPAPRTNRDRMYRTVRLGALADLIVTDEQRYHDPYPCSQSIPPSPCEPALDPKRTYLGATQKAWLKRELEHSPARWKLFAGGTMMMSLDLTRGAPFNTGQWDGYVAERRELGEFLLTKRIRDVVRLSGDIHTFFAGQVTTTGRSDGIPALTEFIGGSISSNGIPEGFRDRLGGDPALIAAITEQVKLVNPHIAYTEQRHRGYCIVEARADELIVDFRAPETVLTPGARMVTLQRFRVPRGEPRIELI
jgi:alkaline phosphatase D